MFIGVRSGLIGCIILGCFAAFATISKDENSLAFVLCRNHKQVRTIRVTTDAVSGSCKIFYTKGGHDQPVGGNRQALACKSVLNGIRANLEAGKWNCRSVNKAQVIQSEETTQ